jgi:hypothetical protein
MVCLVAFPLGVLQAVWVCTLLVALVGILMRLRICRVYVVALSLAWVSGFVLWVLTVFVAVRLASACGCAYSDECNASIIRVDD